MKNIILIITIFIFLGGCQTNTSSDEQTKPNVILIMADDMGYECLGTYGSAEYSTPNLDKLAADGVKFNQAFSQPLCTPSRVKIMTGKHNFRNYTHFGYLNPDQETFGNLLKNVGYKTCIVGKWQLNGIYHDIPGNQDQSRPYEFGFDEYCLWQLTKGRGEGERFADPLINTNEELMRLEGQYGPDVFRDYMFDFIDRNKDTTFFVYFPMVLVHEPFVPTPDSEEWKNEELRHKKDTAFFADMMAYTDKIVGQTREKLEQEGLAENTLLIFTADNGTHPMIYSTMKDGEVIKGAKGKTIETGIRVPMIAYWQGKTLVGSEIDDLVDFNDIIPTIMDAAGVTLQDFHTDGQSFLPAMFGEDYQPREHIYQWYHPRWGRFDSAEYVFNHTYKLYADGRFYNIEEDRMEKNPLDFQDLTAEQQMVWQNFEEVIEAKKTEVVQ